MFNQLPKEDQEKWAKKAKAEAAVAKKKYEEQLKMPPSTDPAARQSCINNLAAFIGPIIEGVHHATGCHVFVAIGGPMKLFDREISTMK